MKLVLTSLQIPYATLLFYKSDGYKNLNILFLLTTRKLTWPNRMGT